MQIESIFIYQSARRYLLDFVEKKQALDPEFSLRRWCKAMGLKSHAHMVMILQGKRALTLKQVPYLSKGMNLSSPERLFLQALIQFDNADTPEEKALCQLWISEVNPGSNFKVREVDEYIVIAHWVHMAILSMTINKNFSCVPEHIHERLGDKVTLAEVRAAVERLKDMGLIVEKNGRMECTYARVTSKDDVASRGAREYHKQVAKLGIDAVEAQDVNEREFQSFAVSVPRAKIPLAKEMIRKFRTQFYEAMTSEPGDDVYQTVIQLFRLTERPSVGLPKEDEGTGSSSPNAAQKERKK